MSDKNKKELDKTVITEDKPKKNNTPKRNKEVKPKRIIKSDKENVKLYTLIDLINNYEDSLYALTKVSEKGLYPKYLDELESKEKGLKITPTVTDSEFKEILK